LQAAELGNTEAKHRVAELVLIKKNPLADEAQAESYLRKAAAVGNVDACLLLSRVLFERGACAEARRIIAPAAKTDHVTAIHQLGLLYCMEKESQANPEEAVECFERAALLGNARAMVSLARCLETGFGTEPSFTEASRWMKLAASAGDAEARAWCQSRQVDVAPMALRE
jgi:TPR repeat protein